MLVPDAKWVTLVDLLRYRVTHEPAKVVYRFLTDGEGEAVEMTYAQLDQQARAIATDLQRLVKPGERALLLSPPGCDFITAFFGCLYAGVIAVPVPLGSHRHVQRILAISEDAQATVVLTTSSILARIQRQLGPVATMTALHWLVIDQQQRASDHVWQEGDVTGYDLALLQYTSGSTGSPKGVMVSHENLLHNVELICQAFGAYEDGVDAASCVGVSWLPMYHDMGLMHMFLPLYVNASTVFLTPTAFIEKPVRWLQAVSCYQATVSGGPNFAYELCLEKVTAEQRQGLDLSSWQIAFCGAEPIRAATLQRFTDTFAACGLRQSAPYPCYGLAEATLMVSGGERLAPPLFYTVSSTALGANRVVETLPAEGDATTIVGCGKALPHQKTLIVQPETCTICSTDHVGEIWIASPSIAQGYWRRPEETAQTFRAFLADTGEGPFLRTGDMGFLREDELFVVGRIKDMLIIQGQNYYPQDIEQTVSQSHPALKIGFGAAFAVAVEGVERLVIVHEVERGYVRQINVDEVLAAIRLSIARNHGILASAVCLVKPWQLPRTSSGKVQRHICREQFLQGSLKVIRQWSTLTLPHTETLEMLPHTLTAEIETPEQQLATALVKWLVREIAQHLALDVEEIAPDQPFVRYGVDSMEAINLACALEVKLDCSLPPSLIWDYPSISLLAEHLAHEAALTHPIAIPAIIQRFAEITPVSVAHTPNSHASAASLGVPAHVDTSCNEQRLAALNERYYLGQETGNYFYQPVITKQDGAWVISQGRRMLMMASYGYLGLLGHPRINAAAQAALLEFGTGTHGVRLLAGTLSLHRELEQAIARFKHSEDAVVFTSGYIANVATIATLASKRHVVICDQLDHASIIDGCTLSQAQLMLFRHNDMPDLERCQRLAGQRSKLVIVDAVFSMDGDVINLPEVARLCKQYGAYLMVDEAHSLGVLGATGHGIEEHFGLESQTVDVKMGTLSKTIPSVGGYVAGKGELITALKHNARPFIFSAALPPPQIAAAQAALEIIEEEPQLVATLQHRIKRYLAGLWKIGLNTLRSETAIVPIVCATEVQAFEMTRFCQAEGLFVLPIIYPAVPINAPRLRTTITAQHTDEDIDFALDVFQRAGRQCGLIR